MHLSRIDFFRRGLSPSNLATTNRSLESSYQRHPQKAELRAFEQSLAMYGLLEHAVIISDSCHRQKAFKNKPDNCQDRPVHKLDAEKYADQRSDSINRVKHCHLLAKI